MNTFRKGGLFTDMKMNTTANFHKQMPAYSLPYKKYGPLKRKKSCLSAIGYLSPKIKWMWNYWLSMSN